MEGSSARLRIPGYRRNQNGPLLFARNYPADFTTPPGDTLPPPTHAPTVPSDRENPTNNPNNNPSNGNPSNGYPSNGNPAGGNSSNGNQNGGATVSGSGNPSTVSGSPPYGNVSASTALTQLPASTSLPSRGAAASTSSSAFATSPADALSDGGNSTLYLAILIPLGVVLLSVIAVILYTCYIRRKPNGQAAAAASMSAVAGGSSPSLSERTIVLPLTTDQVGYSIPDDETMSYPDNAAATAFNGTIRSEATSPLVFASLNRTDAHSTEPSAAQLQNSASNPFEDHRPSRASSQADEFATDMFSASTAILGAAAAGTATTRPTLKNPKLAAIKESSSSASSPVATTPISGIIDFSTAMESNESNNVSTTPTEPAQPPISAVGAFMAAAGAAVGAVVGAAVNSSKSPAPSTDHPDLEHQTHGASKIPATTYGNMPPSSPSHSNPPVKAETTTSIRSLAQDAVTKSAIAGHEQTANAAPTSFFGSAAAPLMAAAAVVGSSKKSTQETIGGSDKPQHALDKITTISHDDATSIDETHNPSPSMFNSLKIQSAGHEIELITPGIDIDVVDGPLSAASKSPVSIKSNGSARPSESSSKQNFLSVNTTARASSGASSPRSPNAFSGASSPVILSGGGVRVPTVKRNPNNLWSGMTSPQVVSAAASSTGVDDDDLDDMDTYHPPAPTSHVATAAYTPQNPDEMLIQAGDLIGIEKTYKDGWARGQNISQSRKRCIFPLAVVTPIVSGPSQTVRHRHQGNTWMGSSGTSPLPKSMPSSPTDQDAPGMDHGQAVQVDQHEFVYSGSNRIPPRDDSLRRLRRLAKQEKQPEPEVNPRRSRLSWINGMGSATDRSHPADAAAGFARLTPSAVSATNSGRKSATAMPGPSEGRRNSNLQYAPMDRQSLDSVSSEDNSISSTT